MYVSRPFLCPISKGGVYPRVWGQKHQLKRKLGYSKCLMLDSLVLGDHLKSGICLILILFIGLVFTPRIDATAFHDIPPEHWIFDALTDLVEMELIMYPIAIAREFNYSRIEAAMLVATFLNTHMIDGEQRGRNQDIIIREILEHYASRAELDLTVLQLYQDMSAKDTPSSLSQYNSLFVAMPKEIVMDVYQALVAEFLMHHYGIDNEKIVANRPDQWPQDVVGYEVAVESALKLAVELRDEIYVFGAQITVVEESIVNNIVVKEKLFVLSSTNMLAWIPVWVNETGVSLANQGHGESVKLAHRDGDISRTTIRDVWTDEKENGVQGRSRLRVGSQQEELFAGYRLIDFSMQDPAWRNNLE